MNFNETKYRYNKFIDSCYEEGQGYRLTLNSEVSPYALCFAIFGKHLIGQSKSIEKNSHLFMDLLLNNINKYRHECVTAGRLLETDKGYLQLLTFTLSAASIIEGFSNNDYSSHILPLVKNKNIINILENSGVFNGHPGTGNLAMFYAIILIHANKYLNYDTNSLLNCWLEKHIDSMNSNGFWGSKKTKKYLQFQNGYHQYEIFKYVGTPIEKIYDAISFVLSLADEHGHFAPYPGGGGCYDYDAVFILTFLDKCINDKHKNTLERTLGSIISEQNQDGGFAESQYIRPINLHNLTYMLSHINHKKSIMHERARYSISLLRAKHNRIHTHWTKYSREWGESDLWDSWFRMLTIAKIDKLIGSNNKWGFIKYPGIGYDN